MSLIYRAIWEVDPVDVVALSQEHFSDWVAEKYPGLVPGEGDPTVAQIAGDEVAVVWQTVSEGDLSAIEATLTEDRPTERWMTRLRAMSNHTGSWFWVDLERVTSDVFSSHLVIAPRLVTTLLEAGPRPRVGPAPLDVGAQVLVRPSQVESQLVNLILHAERTTPVIVFSHAHGDDPKRTVERAEQAATILAGIATVFALAPNCQQRFEEILGKELSVWGGAARMYLPGRLDPWRHRYLRPDVVKRHRRAGGERFGQMLSRSIAARRAPELYAQVRPLLRAPGGASVDELLAVAEAQVEERNVQIDDLRSQLEDEQDRALNALADIEVLQDELKGMRSKLRALKYQHGDSEQEAAMSLPDSPTGLVEVAEWVREHLDRVELLTEACRDLDELDRAIEAQAWADTSWSGFRALQAYAVEAPNFNGGFWEWCERSGNPDAWPATPKKLAMKESETVANNATFRQARTLPVSSEISDVGEIVMEAHLKIAEGGGGNAPRVYFHDATATTGKIHVGFFGPHRHMPNTKTN